MAARHRWPRRAGRSPAPTPCGPSSRNWSIRRRERPRPAGPPPSASTWPPPHGWPIATMRPPWPPWSARVCSRAPPSQRQRDHPPHRCAAPLRLAECTRRCHARHEVWRASTRFGPEGVVLALAGPVTPVREGAAATWNAARDPNRLPVRNPSRLAGVAVAEVDDGLGLYLNVHHLLLGHTGRQPDARPGHRLRHHAHPARHGHGAHQLDGRRPAPVGHPPWESLACSSCSWATASWRPEPNGSTASSRFPPFTESSRPRHGKRMPGRPRGRPGIRLRGVEEASMTRRVSGRIGPR